MTRVLPPEVSGVWGESVWCENTFGNILIAVMRKNGEPGRQVARGDGFKLKHLISLLWSCRIHHLSAWCFSCVRLEFQVCVDRLGLGTDSSGSLFWTPPRSRMVIFKKNEQGYRAPQKAAARADSICNWNF